MIVETHAFKAAFVAGRTNGFVVCAERPATPGYPARPVFAEIYGPPGCYHIFEVRSAAEFQVALAATGTPPLDGLSVREVRVENIRDYHTLAGFKTVFLVDREGRATQSLRVGDAPLAARTDTPFPFPHREGLRVARSLPTLKPFPSTAPPVPSGATPGDKREVTASRPRPTATDPFSHVPIDEGVDPSRLERPATPLPTGFIYRLVRALFAPFR